MFKNYIYVYKKLFQYNKKLIFQQIAEILLRVIAPFMAMILPAFIVYLLEQEKSTNQIIICIISAFIIYGLISSLKDGLVQSDRLRYIEFRIAVLLPEFFKKCISIDYNLYENEETQKTATNAYYSVMEGERGGEGMIHALTSFLENLLGIILYTIFVAAINPWLIILFFVSSYLQYVVYGFVNKRMRKSWEKRSEFRVTQKYLNGQAYNTTAGKDIRLFSLSDWISGKYKQSIDCEGKIEKKVRYMYFGNDLFGLAMQLLRDAFCYYYLFKMFRNGMSAATFIVLIGAVVGFSVWFTGITNAIGGMQSSSFSVSMFRKFLDIKNKVRAQVVLPETNEGFEVEFDHVAFCYQGAEEYVLKDISFSISSNEKVALLGINGAGKSTLIKLICGFYKPTSGSIYINGTDITKLNVEKYQQKISAIFQDAFLPHFTLLENVTCKDFDENDIEKIQPSLEKAGFLDRIKSLKYKERTYLGNEMSEEGVNLSGGELQKLNFARAIHRNSNLLLLDEPTAALDAIAEQEMYEHYADVAKSRTSIFISHRLASTKFCNKILLLNNGVIEEKGTHEQLLEKNGVYASMYEAQRQNYKKGGVCNVAQV